ncbi:MAG: hypothetical protein K0S55_1161 [Clostridia bacterium]|jgi:hypothetical protein|nr:hypothetical protein [Clostridia bacterium]
MKKSVCKLTVESDNEISNDNVLIYVKIEGINEFSIKNKERQILNIPEGEYKIILSREKSYSYYDLRICSDLIININWDIENDKIEIFPQYC